MATPKNIEDISALLQEDFSTVLHRWAQQSARQLKDSYKMQKMWTGSKSDEVWSARTVTRKVPKYDKKGNKVGTREVKVKQRGWYDESKYREAHDKSGKAWYSTGLSYRTADVEVLKDTLQAAEIRFHTTTGALFAEAGVGANGPKAVRGGEGSGAGGKTLIKVDRSKNYSSRSRYVLNWIPGRGYAHRPNTRQQVNLLHRRMKWATRRVYCYELSKFLVYSIDEEFLKLNGIDIDNGMTLSVSGGGSHTT